MTSASDRTLSGANPNRARYKLFSTGDGAGQTIIQTGHLLPLPLQALEDGQVGETMLALRPHQKSERGKGVVYRSMVISVVVFGFVFICPAGSPSKCP